MFNLDSLRRTVFGTVVATLTVGSVLASSGVALAGEDDVQASGFSQVAAAPVYADAPIDQLVGTVGAPLVNVNIPCPAAWNQGGLLGADFNACSTAPVYQQDAGVNGSLLGR